MKLGDAIARCRNCPFLIRGGKCGSKTAGMRAKGITPELIRYAHPSPVLEPPITEVENCPRVSETEAG
jgi:hypothetical protein